MHNKLIGKVNNIDTSGFVLQAKYTAKKSDLEEKLVIQTKKVILVGLLKKTTHNAKIAKIESLVPS